MPTELPSRRKVLGLGPADWACAGVLLAVTLGLFAKGLAHPDSIVHEDAAWQFQPYYQFAADEVRAGRFPHWCPYVSCGMPFHSTLHGAMLYPLRWPLFWMDYSAGYVASLIVHFYLLALFTCLFMRGTLRCRPLASLVGAMSFAFGGFAFGHVTHWNYFQAYPWLMLTLFLFSRAIERSSWTWAVAAALPIALIGLVGAVHLLLLLGLALAVWAVGETAARAATRGSPRRASQGVSPLESGPEGRAGTARRRMGETPMPPEATGKPHILFPIAAVAVACGLGGLMAFAQLLPGQFQSQLSARGGGASWEFITEMCADPLPAAERMVVPFLYGNSRLGYWGENNYHETTFYAGIVPLAAAILALGLWRRNRWVPRLAVFAAVMFVLAAGRFLPAFRLLYDWVPGFDRLRNPVRIFVWVQFAIACLAAIGIDGTLSKGPHGPATAGAASSRRKTIAAIVTGTVILAMLAGGVVAVVSLRARDSWGRGFILSMDRADDIGRQERLAALGEMARKVMDDKDPATWAGVAAAAASAIAVSAFFAVPRLGRRWAAGVLAGLLALDLGLASTGMLHFSQQGRALDRAPEEVRFLQAHLGEQRYISLRGIGDDATGWNRGMQFRIANAATPDPGVFFHTPAQEWLVGMTYQSRRVADLVGAKYLVAGGEMKEANLSLAYHNDGTWIYENAQAFPLAFLARRVVVEDARQMEADIARGTTDLRDVALVEAGGWPPAAPGANREEANLAPSSPDEPAGEVLDFHSAPEEYRMRTRSGGERQLVLTVTAHPEWKCEVDGREVAIRPTDLGFMSVGVPAGSHDVRWWFEPESFRMGVVGTILGSILTAGALAAALLGKRRRHLKPHP